MNKLHRYVVASLMIGIIVGCIAGYSAAINQSERKDISQEDIIRKIDTMNVEELGELVEKLNRKFGIHPPKRLKR